MKTKRYSNDQRDDFYLAMGYNAVEIYRYTGRYNRYEWHDKYTDELLGYETPSGNYMLVVHEEQS